MQKLRGGGVAFSTLFQPPSKRFCFTRKCKNRHSTI